MKKQFVKPFLFALTVAIIAGIIYIPALDYSFQFDDQIHIIDNTTLYTHHYIKNPEVWKHHGNRPLSRLSFIVSYDLTGNSVEGFRLVNYLLHLLNTFLIYLLALKLLSNISPRDKKHLQLQALFISALFLIHPIQIQSVVYIIQRMNLLSAFFVLLSLLIYINIREAFQQKGLTIGSALLIPIALILALAGFLSKQNAAVLPFLILVIEFIAFSGKQLREKILRYGISLIFLAIILFFIITNGIPSTNNSTTPLAYFVTQWEVLIKYIQLIIIPISQNIDYAHSVQYPPYNLWVFIFAFIHLVLIGGAILYKKGNKIVRLGILWFYAAHIIESGIIPISDIMVEHRNYLPLFGILLILSECGSYLFIKYKNAAVIYPVALILAFGTCSFIRIQKWETMESLWTDSAKKNPLNKRAWNNLAYACINSNPSKSIQSALKAIQIDSTYYQAYDNLGAALLISGDTNNAIKSFNASIKYGPEQNFAPYYNVGNCLTDTSPQEALQLYKKVLEVNPRHCGAITQIGYLLFNANQLTEALYYYNYALQYNPLNRIALVNASIIYEKLGQDDMAIQYLTNALEQPDNHGSIYEMLTNIYGRNQRYSEATISINHAIEINPSADNYRKRGFIMQNMGDYRNALLDYHKAQEIQFSQSVDDQIDICNSHIKNE